jgi:hypothetical protein
MKTQAHEKPIKTLGVLPGPLILTGSEDHSIKVCIYLTMYLTLYSFYLSIYLSIADL